MIAALLTHIIITAGCLWAGSLCYRFIFHKKEVPPVIFSLVTGLITLTLLAQLLVLFIPIDIYVQISITAVLILFAALNRSYCRLVFSNFFTEINSLSILCRSLLCVLWVIILLIHAGPVLMDDTDSYHIQMIKWIQEYGTVPGIVNLHERFGFNSSWFSSVALFSISADTTAGYTSLNSILSLWFCFYLLAGFSRMIKKNIPAAFSLLGLFAFSLLVWPMTRGNAATTNYDFITTVLTVILFIETILNKKKEDLPGPEWLIWPAYLFTVRIINFPVLILSLFMLAIIIKRKNFTGILPLLITSLLLIVPFLARNTIISGYPFFPSLGFDIFSADWKADPVMTEELIRYIKYYGRISTTYMDIEQTASLNFPKWIPHWFRHLFLFDKITVLAGVAGVIGLGSLLLLKKNHLGAPQKVFLFIFFIWLFVWFFLSPDPRFIYGLLLSGLFLLVYSFFSVIRINNISPSVINGLMILFISAATFYAVYKPVTQKEYRNWVSTAKLPEPPAGKIVIDGIIFRIPQPVNNNWNARCYGTALPCLYKIHPRLRPRGKNISAGFRLEK